MPRPLEQTTRIILRTVNVRSVRSAFLLWNLFGEEKVKSLIHGSYLCTQSTRFGTAVLLSEKSFPYVPQPKTARRFSSRTVDRMVAWDLAIVGLRKSGWSITANQSGSLQIISPEGGTPSFYRNPLGISARAARRIARQEDPWLRAGNSRMIILHPYPHRLHRTLQGHNDVISVMQAHPVIRQILRAYPHHDMVIDHATLRAIHRIIRSGFSK